MDNRFVVLTEYYRSSRNNRYKEIVKSIEVNCRIDQTKQVVLFMEPNTIFPSELKKVLSEENFKKIKIHYIRPNDRATYGDFFAYANEHLIGERCILCNNDISFDETLEHIDGFNLTGYFICLTRWDLKNDNSLIFKQPTRLRKNSQDAWIFTPKLPMKMIQKGQFYMGRPGCDGMISYLATLSGLRILNPSEVVKAKHLHLSDYRTYGKKHRMGGHPIYMCCFPNDKVEYVPEKVMHRRVVKGQEELKLWYGEEATTLVIREELDNEKHWNYALKKCMETK